MLTSGPIAQDGPLLCAQMTISPEGSPRGLTLRGLADELGDVCLRAQVRLLEVLQPWRSAEVRLEPHISETWLAATDSSTLGAGLHRATAAQLRNTLHSQAKR